MKLPISKISELTGIHRDTISKRLADLPFEASKKGAKFYSSEDALAAIYKIECQGPVTAAGRLDANRIMPFSPGRSQYFVLPFKNCVRFVHNSVQADT